MNNRLGVTQVVARISRRQLILVKIIISIMFAITFSHVLHAGLDTTQQN